MAVVCALTALLGVASADDDDDDKDEHKKFTFALWGDTPYNLAVETPKIAAMTADINAAKVAFTIFDGDIKSGSSRCDDPVYAAAIARFNQFERPMVYVPGDNEWTDCHRKNNGGYDNLERLAFLRQTMFAAPDSFGRRRLRLEHQDAPYVENTRWKYGDVAFVGLDVPGSNNNKTSPADCPASNSVRTQAQCDADNVEYAARDAANIAFLRESFAQVREEGALGLVVVIQADPNFDLPETEGFDERTQRPGFDGYNAFLDALLTESRSFNGQVVLVHGDTHFFKIDKPLVNQANLVANLTRVETFGSPNIHWIRVTVDPKTRSLFNLEPMIVPGN